MLRRAASSWVVIVALAGLAPGCKGMGGIASGLGKAAASAAGGIAHAAPAITRGVAQVGNAVARTVARTAPAALQVGEVMLQTAIAQQLEFEIPVDTSSHAPVLTDPCQVCPLDSDCEACVGYAGYACLASPAGALARCESSAPPDAPPAPDPDPLPASPGAPPPAPAYMPPPPPAHGAPPPPGAPEPWF